MGEGNAGVFDYTAIKTILNAKGYQPICEFEKPRCPRWTGQTCSRPCAQHSDCWNAAPAERKPSDPNITTAAGDDYCGWVEHVQKVRAMFLRRA